MAELIFIGAGLFLALVGIRCGRYTSYDEVDTPWTGAGLEDLLGGE